MNITEVGKAMEDGQIAYSPTDKWKIIKKENGLYYYHGEDKENSQIVSVDMNIIYINDWEIELPFVDFWTAWQAARDENWAILWEKAECPTIYSNLLYISPEMINGRWQILNQ